MSQHRIKVRLLTARVLSQGMAALMIVTCVVGCRSERAPDAPPTGSGPPTLVGVSVQPRPGESYRAARVAADNRYGSVDVIRFFDPSLPNSWPDIRRHVGAHPVAVSFKAPPSEVLSGVLDKRLRAWFAHAPRIDRTWWSYLPEPEDAIDSGRYSASDFRRAWRHLYRLAAEADNPQLLSTLTLMCYTLNPSSKRDWRDYFPGDGYVDVMGWDCYNTGWRRGRYASPVDIFGEALALSAKLNKPWAIPETGSLLAGDDTGSGRARWIADLITYARAHRAQFVTFFDADTGEDYRLLDRASQKAVEMSIDG